MQIRQGDRMISKSTTADLLNVHERTVGRLIEDGQLIACRVRGTLRVSERSVYEYLNRQVAKYCLDEGINFDEADFFGQDMTGGDSATCSVTAGERKMVGNER